MGNGSGEPRLLSVKARRGLSVARPECTPRELGGIQPWSDARALATAERTPRRVEECRLRGEILGAWRGAAAGDDGRRRRRKRVSAAECGCQPTLLLQLCGGAKVSTS